MVAGSVPQTIIGGEASGRNFKVGKVKSIKSLQLLQEIFCHSGLDQCNSTIQEPNACHWGIRIPVIGQVFRAAVSQVPLSQSVGLVTKLLKKTRHQWEVCRQPHLKEAEKANNSRILFKVGKSLEIEVYIGLWRIREQVLLHSYRLQWILRDELETCPRGVSWVRFWTLSLSLLWFWTLQFWT